MSVLSTVQDQPTSGSSTRSTKSPPIIILNEEPGEPEQILVDVVETTRLAFMLLSEAMYKHPHNAEWFRVSFMLHRNASQVDVLARLALATNSYLTQHYHSSLIHKRQRKLWGSYFLSLYMTSRVHHSLRVYGRIANLHHKMEWILYWQPSTGMKSSFDARLFAFPELF